MCVLRGEGGGETECSEVSLFSTECLFWRPGSCCVAQAILELIVIHFLSLPSVGNHGRGLTRRPEVLCRCQRLSEQGAHTAQVHTCSQWTEITESTSVGIQRYRKPREKAIGMPYSDSQSSVWSREWRMSHPFSYFPTEHDQLQNRQPPCSSQWDPSELILEGAGSAWSRRMAGVWPGAHQVSSTLREKAGRGTPAVRTPATPSFLGMCALIEGRRQ